MNRKRGRQPTADKTRAELIMPALSEKQFAAQLRRNRLALERNAAGLPPPPKPAYSAAEIAKHKRLCQRFLWLRENGHKQGALLADLEVFLTVEKSLDKYDLLAGYFRKQKIRLLNDGVDVRPGEHVEDFRPLGEVKYIRVATKF